MGGALLSAFLLPGPLIPQIRTNPGQNSQIPGPPSLPQPMSPSPSETTQRQKEALVKYNFKQMKKHADQLSKLAQSLQKKIDQSNENVLSLDVVRNAEKIEKLAKKIKDEAKGY